MTYKYVSVQLAILLKEKLVLTKSAEPKQMFPGHNSTFIKTLCKSDMSDFLTLRSGRKETTQGVFLLLDAGLYSTVKTSQVSCNPSP